MLEILLLSEGKSLVQRNYGFENEVFSILEGNAVKNAGQLSASIDQNWLGWLTKVPKVILVNQ